MPGSTPSRLATHSCVTANALMRQGKDRIISSDIVRKTRAIPNTCAFQLSQLNGIDASVVNASVYGSRSHIWQDSMEQPNKFGAQCVGHTVTREPSDVPLLR